MTTGEVDLNAVAAAIGQPLGDQVLDGQAQLAPVAVPGIQRTAVWRVRDESGATSVAGVRRRRGRTARYGCSPRTRPRGPISFRSSAPTSTTRPMRAPTSRPSWRSRAGRWSSSSRSPRSTTFTGVRAPTRRRPPEAALLAEPARPRVLGHTDGGRLPRGARARGRPAAPAQHFRCHARRGDCEQLVPRAGGAPPAPDRPLTHRSRETDRRPRGRPAPSAP